MKKDISCDIVRDLLVSYMDDTCSEESRNTVKEHLEECDSCRNELESYTANIENDTKKEINLATSKPFRKIKHRIRFLVIVLCIIAVIITPVIIYGSYRYSHNGFEADKKFFSVSEKDFFADTRFNNYLIQETKTLYTCMYYTLKEKRGESVYDNDVSELLEEYNMIRNVKPDYDSITYEPLFENHIQVTLPLITPWDSYKTWISIVFIWEAPGRYSPYSVALDYEEVSKYGYGPSVYWVYGDMYEPWPFYDIYFGVNYLEKINLIRNHKGTIPAVSDNTPETDTGHKIKSGVYRYENDRVYENQTFHEKTDLIFFDDRTVFYKRYSDEKDTAILKIAYDTKRPSKYFTTVTEDGAIKINVFYSKKLKMLGTISDISDTEITMGNKVFRLISEDLPDEKELEKIVKENSIVKYHGDERK